MAKKTINDPYYCTHCKSYHKEGDIYSEHEEYDAKIAIKNSINKDCQFISEDVIIPEGALEIKDLESSVVIKKIDLLYNKLKDQIEEGFIPSLDIPLRRRENIIYNDQNRYFLGKKTRRIMLGDQYSDLLRILYISTHVKKLLKKDLHATKREIFYSNVNLIEDQKYSDMSIEDLAAFLGIYRENLHIIASAKGSCVGRLRIRDEDDIIDLEGLGGGGWSISPLLKNIEIIESDAEFILVVEKDAAMMRLSEAKFWKTIPCILLTAQGSPNYASRPFLKKMVSELKIPVFGLADSDPYGLNILMTYAYGGIQSAYETSKLAVNNFYWLGVLPKDIEEYNLKDYCRIPMNKEDIRRAEYMLKEHPILNHVDLKEQLELTLNSKIKAEIQALSSHGLEFLIEYIINKIETGDFIKF